MRFVVQWIASERARKSVIPVAFWFFSIGGGVLAADLRAVSPRPGIHRGPGARLAGLHPQSVFHHRQWTAVIGEGLSAREPKRTKHVEPLRRCLCMPRRGRGEGSGAIGFAAKIDVANRRFQRSSLFGREAGVRTSAERGFSLPRSESSNLKNSRIRSEW